MKSLFTIILAGLASGSALAQKPFIGLYAGAAMSKVKQFPMDILKPVPVWAGRAEAGLTWRKKLEVGIQVNVQPWRLDSETWLTVFKPDPQRLVTVDTKVDYAAPATTALAFGRYTTTSGFRMAAGLGYSRAFAKGGPVRFENGEKDGVSYELPTYVQGWPGGGFATSLQAGYKRNLAGQLSLAMDAAAAYSAMRTKGTYGMFCFSATAGVQYSF
jgi:hypothetical protein